MKRKNAHLGTEVILKSTGEKGIIFRTDFNDDLDLKVKVDFPTYQSWFQLHELKLADKEI